MRYFFSFLLLACAAFFQACDNLSITAKKDADTTTKNTTTTGTGTTTTDPNITTPNITTTTDPNPNRSLVGVWKFVSVESPDLNSDQENQALREARVEFTNDGRFLATNPNDAPSSGSYVYDAAQNVLMTTEENGKTERATVQWQGARIVLTFEDGKVTMERIR